MIRPLMWTYHRQALNKALCIHASLFQFPFLSASSWIRRSELKFRRASIKRTKPQHRVYWAFIKEFTSSRYNFSARSDGRIISIRICKSHVAFKVVSGITFLKKTIRRRLTQWQRRICVLLTMPVREPFAVSSITWEMLGLDPYFSSPSSCWKWWFCISDGRTIGGYSMIMLQSLPPTDIYYCLMAT